MKFSIAQFNGVMRGKPFYSAITAVGNISIPTEVYEGDLIQPVDTVVTGGYPTATYTSSLTVNAADQGGSYQTATGDAGKVLRFVKQAQNALGSISFDTGPVTIQTPVGFGDMGYVGGNVEGTTDFSSSPLFRNAVYDGRGFGYSGTYSSSPLQGGNAGAQSQGGSITLTLLSGLSYTLTVSSWTINPLMSNASDVGRVFSLTIGGLPYTATVTAQGTTSGTATAAPNANTSSCTVTLSATPTILTGITTWSIAFPIDVNGWPLQKSEIVITSVPGQLPYGPTYQFTVKSKNPALTIISSGGQWRVWNAANPTPTTVMNFTGVLDSGTGITTYTFFGYFNSSGLILEISDAITFMDIPRDGSATSNDGGTIFNTAALAHYSRFKSLRFMDFCGTNGKAETDWSTRTPYHQVPTQPFSWETLIDFCNALHDYPGSKVQQVWVNIGGLCTTPVANTRTGVTYVENLPQLANTWNSGANGYAGFHPSLKVMWEYGNEPWNTGFNLYKQYLVYSMAEMNALITSGYIPNGPYMVSNLTASGSTVTVNCTGVKPAFITNGATMLCSTDTSLWQGLDGGASLANLSSPAPIANVTTGTDGNGNPIYSFTYQTAGTGGATTFAGTARFMMTFNLNSTLALDQQILPAASQQVGVNTFYATTAKWMVRSIWRTAQVFKYGGVGGATRPNDRFVMNLQQYGGTGGPQWAYGQWLDSTGNPENTHSNANPLMGHWLYAAAVAPYLSANSFCRVTGGTSVVSNVPTFTALSVNDTIAIPSGNTNNVTVAGVAVLSNYLSSVITAISGNVITLADRATSNTATVAAGTITNGGTGYTNGTFYNVPMSGGVGTGAQATITVASGIVTTVVFTNPGTGYGSGDTLSAPTSFIGAGSGFVFTTTNATLWIGNTVMVMAKTGGSTATLGAQGVGYMQQGSNQLVFSTPITGLVVGDTLGVNSVGGYPLNSTVTHTAVIYATSITAAGTGYTGTTYASVPLIGGAGTGAMVNITISSGALASFTWANRGTGYSINDTLTFSNTFTNNAGTGATIKVTNIATQIKDFAYVGSGTSAITQFGAILNGGSGYTDGTYTSVALTGGSGTGAVADVVVLGGVVISVGLHAAAANTGSNYLVGDVLSSSALGAGTGFQVGVAQAASYYAKVTSGTAAGTRGACQMTVNNTFLAGFAPAGLSVGDTVTVPGLGNPALYATITNLDSSTGNITLDRSVNSQQTLAAGAFTPTVQPTATFVLTGVNPASFTKSMIINMSTSDNYIRSHVATCKYNGVHPLAYEGGPDTQCAPLWQNEIHSFSDPLIGMDAFTNSLLDMWFQNGGEEFHYFTLGPKAWSDGSLTPSVDGGVSPGNLGNVFVGGYLSQSLWAVCQTYTDTALQAPKMAALLAYNTPKWYQNIMTYPTTGTTPFTAIPFIRLGHYGLSNVTATGGVYRADSAGVIGSSTVALTGTNFLNTKMTFWTVNNTQRSIYIALPVPRSGTYQAVVWGTDTAAGTQVQLAVDQVAVAGSQTLPQNGSGTVAAANPGPCPVGQTVQLTSGIHLFQAILPVGVGTTSVGLYTIKLVPWAA